MAHRSEERPDEVQELRKRLDRLERRVDEEAADARRSWQSAAGLAAGVTALFLSLSLPWLRSPRRDHNGFEEPFGLDAEQPLRLGEPRSFVTGWEVWGASFLDQRAVVLAFLALAVLAGLAVTAILLPARWPFIGVQACSFAVPFLFLVLWPGDSESSAVLGPGPVVAVLACAVTGLVATRGKVGYW